MLNSLKIKEYVNDKSYLIYKKSLSYKDGMNRFYYLVIKDNRIIDMFIEKELEGLIDEERLSNDNIDLIVYKAVKCENNRYYSFRMRGRIEYRIGELVEVTNSIGIFCCKDPSLTEEHYNTGEDKVILKVKVKIDDVVGGNTRDFTFKKCIPIEVIY